MHRGSHHLNLLVQGSFGSGVPGDLICSPGPSLFPTMKQEERAALRETLREARRSLSDADQAAASQGVLDILKEEPFFQDASRVAFYQQVDGEIGPLALSEFAMAQGKSCYLPVVNRDSEQILTFAPYDANTEMVPNEWGIAEPPLPAEIISPTIFDVVFVPLVGFDNNCFRLGMGKGFYDRTFSFKIFNRRSQPLLVGLAHECQKMDPFPTETWDVRLDAVATPKKIYRPDTA